MNRKDRRRQTKLAAQARPVPRPPPRALALSDLLLRHAGQDMAPPADLGELAAASGQPGAGALDAGLAALRRQDEDERKLAEFERAVAAAPGSLRLLLGLAEVQRRLKRNDAAAATYRRCLELAPGRADIQYMIDALGGGPPPGRAAEAYVVSQFDSLAERYDEKVRRWLDYQGPEIVHRAAVAALGADPPPQAILDLGCGTGLAAPLLRPLARRLDGVDLSPAMIAKAKERGLYDDLAVDDICRHLALYDSDYTLAIAADVLVYFGALAEPFDGVFRALKPGGLFIATVEKGAVSPYSLAPTGRYAHDDGYARRAAAAAGFAVVAASEETLRLEERAPVAGRCYTLKKPG
ncbi:MAG: methyltransferase domain-containing protein [Pseudomonadota bacterium]